MFVFSLKTGMHAYVSTASLLDTSNSLQRSVHWIRRISRTEQAWQ